MKRSTPCQDITTKKCCGQKYSVARLIKGADQVNTTKLRCPKCGKLLGKIQ